MSSPFQPYQQVPEPGRRRPSATMVLIIVLACLVTLLTSISLGIQALNLLDQQNSGTVPEATPAQPVGRDV